MEFRNLGPSGLRVSLVGLGCNNFGMRLDLEQTRAVIHQALDAGITLFDTADVYGGRGGSGVYNAISAGGLIDGVGYTPIFAGSSYIQAVRWQQGWPVVQAIVTYSQSTDPDSPHFSDMTQVFSDQGWVSFPYRMGDMQKDQIDSISLFEKR